MNLTTHWAGLACVSIFIAAYALVVAEERLRLRKSVPVTVAAGVCWVLAVVAGLQTGRAEAVEAAFRHTLLDFAELFLFLLSAITFVNTLEERQVFDALRGWLVARGLTLRGVFWTTGALAFCISSFLPNLTAALVIGAVALAAGGASRAFVVPACVNIVVAANAGGAFSPFGDITTLMVWQAGRVEFAGFLALFLPALVNWLVPASIMSLAVPRVAPEGESGGVAVRAGGGAVALLFLATIAGTVVLHQALHLPPVLGMMTGLGALKVFAWRLQHRLSRQEEEGDTGEILAGFDHKEDSKDSFDIFRTLQRVEWDTLMFFYGVMLSIGALNAMGYLAALSRATYAGLGATASNILVGLASAVIDNIPVMFAVITMNPEMSQAQWLLVTLTAGVGGSLLSVGSAAGVALMGQARGVYTFGAHLKWAWAVALGYAASAALHLLLNGR